MQLRRINKRRPGGWLTPFMATAAAISVVTTAAFGGHNIIRTQEYASGPVETLLAETSFADGATTVIPDSAVTTQGEEAGEIQRAVKEFHRDEPFSQFALTWHGQRDIAAFVRAKQPDGSWSSWYDMELISSPGIAKNGTEPAYLGPTNDVQVSVSNVDLFAGTEEPAPINGQVPIVEQAANAVSPFLDKIQPVAEVINTSTTLPADLDAVFIDGHAQDGIAPVAELHTYGMPLVVSRVGWGADESKRCIQPTYDTADKAITLHHTAGTTNYTPAQSAAQVRGIYAYHAQTLGWCDIGYNALVDKYGIIYEGRYGGLDRAVQGAHVGGFNEDNWSISMLGDYSQAEPSQAMLNSVANLAGWKAAISGFDPAGTTSMTSGGFNGSRYPAGTTYSGPAFLGHRDLHFTECPGENTVKYWPQLRSAAHAKYLAVSAGTDDDASAGVTPDTATPGVTTPEISEPIITPIAPADPADEGKDEEKSSTGSSSVDKSTVSALIGVASAVALIAVSMHARNHPDEPAVDNNKELAPGVTVQQVPGIVSKVVALTGDPNLQSTWTTVLNAFGPVLGLPIGGPNLADPEKQLIYQLFSNGVVLFTKDTGAHALIGEFAKKWAENPETLGLPTSDQYHIDGKKLRVDFQGGYLVFDPATTQIQLFSN